MSTGAYGLRIDGVADLLLPTLSTRVSWPRLTVTRKVSAAGAARRPVVDQAVADVPLAHGDRVVADRGARTAMLVTAEAEDDGRLLHPFLTTVAVIFAWWDGRHAFHGGAFIDPAGRAWGVLGDRMSGKSSTLARLSLAGMTVLAEDLLVVHRGLACIGPRFVDLRHDAATALGVSDEVGAVRVDQRYRLPLTAAPPEEVPFHGSVFLTWGERVALRRLRPSEWAGRAAAQQSTPTQGAPSLLELAETEAWELVRPREWASLEPAVERLADLVGI
jgi:hypothetical protein